MTNQSQLELGFDPAQAFRLSVRRARKLSRTQWWFRQMRQVVNDTLDWQPAPPPRPEQTWFPPPTRSLSA